MGLFKLKSRRYTGQNTGRFFHAFDSIARFGQRSGQVPSIGGLTSHSSRCRFAARLNSGVRAHMRAPIILVVALLAFSACGAELQPSTSSELELHVSGGFLGPEFAFTLSGHGVLMITRTDHASAPATWQKQLSSPERREIMQLAIRARDFNSGCDREIPDGTNAALLVHSSGQELKQQISLCGRWPSGPKTAALLTAINRHLPSGFKVF